MKRLVQEKMRLLFAVLFILFYFGNSTLQAQIIAELERQFICKDDCINWEPVITQGTAPFSYGWSTGDDEKEINLCPDATQSYMLTITDANQDSLVISEAIIVAPIDRNPIPSVTTPMCVGETVYFYHPNWGYSPDYHWVGPDGIEFNTKDPIIENIAAEDAGEYFLYLNYFDKCMTDSISVFLEIEDIDSKSSCEELSQCNFACNTLEIFGLRGRTTDAFSGGIQPPNFCSDNGIDVTNINWFGFVAQGGDHVLKFRAINCEGDDEGLRFGIYDGCDFTNLLQCTETCSKDFFEISSSMLIPGNSYYAYAEGCGTNICDYSVSVEGTTQSLYCNDYVPFSNATDWKVHTSDLSGSSTFWFNYLRDTIINNNTYRMIGVDGEFSWSGLLLREDEQERIVYRYDPQSNNDKIHYDFSLEVGDEYIVESFNTPFIVTDITPVPSNIGPLKKWTFVSEIGGYPMSYTEGIGGNYLAYPADFLITDPVYNTSVIFSNCGTIIGNAKDEINTYRSELDTTYVSICEGEEFMGYSESTILYDTISQDGSCFHISIINLEVISMGGTEIPYNGLDDDCNPETPDDDIDQDGFVLADDCDDSNASVNPDGIEVPYNGLDEDCDETTLDDDLDQDGFDLADDCDDNNASINPDAVEITNNGIDEDCDGEDLVSSIHEINNIEIQVYPNPVTEELFLDINGNLEYHIKLYNLNGQLVFSESNIKSMSTVNLKNGTYILKFQDLKSANHFTDKIIISK